MSVLESPARGVAAGLLDRTVRAVWSGIERVGAADAVRHRLLTARAVPTGWRRRVTVADTTATFATRTWTEDVRVRTLHGEGRPLARLLDACGPDDVVWDVGANVGLYACLAVRRLDSGRAIAFEPEPANADRLAGNLLANAPAVRWRVERVALGDRDGPGSLATEHPPAARVAGAGHHFLEGDIDDGGDERSGARVADRPRRPDSADRPRRRGSTEGWPGGDTTTGALPADRGWTGDRLPVSERRGDSLVGDGSVPAPDVLKVDVQGAELAVLRGLGEHLDGVHHVLLEVHPEQCGRYGTSVEELVSHLEDRGFELAELGAPADDRSTVWFLEGRR